MAKTRYINSAAGGYMAPGPIQVNPFVPSAGNIAQMALQFEQLKLKKDALEVSKWRNRLSGLSSSLSSSSQKMPTLKGTYRMSAEIGEAMYEINRQKAKATSDLLTAQETKDEDLLNDATQRYRLLDQQEKQIAMAIPQVNKFAEDLAKAREASAKTGDNVAFIGGNPVEAEDLGITKPTDPKKLKNWRPYVTENEYNNYLEQFVGVVKPNEDGSYNPLAYRPNLPGYNSNEPGMGFPHLDIVESGPDSPLNSGIKRIGNEIKDAMDKITYKNIVVKGSEFYDPKQDKMGQQILNETVSSNVKAMNNAFNNWYRNLDKDTQALTEFKHRLTTAINSDALITRYNDKWLPEKENQTYHLREAWNKASAEEKNTIRRDFARDLVMNQVRPEEHITRDFDYAYYELNSNKWSPGHRKVVKATISDEKAVPGITPSHVPGVKVLAIDYFTTPENMPKLQKIFQENPEMQKKYQEATAKANTKAGKDEAFASIVLPVIINHIDEYPELELAVTDEMINIYKKVAKETIAEPNDPVVEGVLGALKQGAQALKDTFWTYWVDRESLKNGSKNKTKEQKEWIANEIDNADYKPSEQEVLSKVTYFTPVETYTKNGEESMNDYLMSQMSWIPSGKDLWVGVTSKVNTQNWLNGAPVLGYEHIANGVSFIDPDTKEPVMKKGKIIGMRVAVTGNQLIEMSVLADKKKDGKIVQERMPLGEMRYAPFAGDNLTVIGRQMGFTRIGGAADLTERIKKAHSQQPKQREVLDNKIANYIATADDNDWYSVLLYARYEDVVDREKEIQGIMEMERIALQQPIQQNEGFNPDYFIFPDSTQVKTDSTQIAGQ